jgi:hypothetical protein
MCVLEIVNGSTQPEVGDVSEEVLEVLEKIDEPGRTRTCNPLIKSPPTGVVAKEDKGVRSAKRGKVRQRTQPRRNQGPGEVR